MSQCSKESPMMCHPNYVEYKKRQMVTVVYGEKMLLDDRGLELEIVESSSGDIISRVKGNWNGDRMFTFTTPAFDAFGYYEITPIVTGGQRERKLVSFSVCCSSSWELYQHMRMLSSPHMILPVTLVLCALCEGTPHMDDPYWDVMCQYGVESLLSSPTARDKLGITGKDIGSVYLKDVYGHIFQQLTLKDFFQKHYMRNAESLLSPVSMETSDEEEHDYEDLDDLRSELSHQPFLSQSMGALNSPNKVSVDIYDDTLPRTGLSGSGQYRNEKGYIKMIRKPISEDLSSKIKESISAKSPAPPSQSRKPPAPPSQSRKPPAPPSQSSKPPAPPSQSSKPPAPPSQSSKPPAPPSQSSKPPAPPSQSSKPGKMQPFNNVECEYTPFEFTPHRPQKTHPLSSSQSAVSLANNTLIDSLELRKHSNTGPPAPPPVSAKPSAGRIGPASTPPVKDKPVPHPYHYSRKH